MENNPFFSVVMPVYGVEKYLENAVSSVLKQKFTDLELILVDDCSPDKSGEICDAFAKKDNRIKVIHLPENGGLSNARNNGVKAVNGRYLFFMDSDDTISDDLFEMVYAALMKNPAEVTVFGIHEEYYDMEDKLCYTNDLSYDEELLLNDEEELHKIVIELEEKTLYGYAWNKIYDVSYLKKIDASFKNITLIEDIVYNVEVFNKIGALNILNTTPYNYKKRINESLTNKFVKDYFILHRQRVEMILNQYKSWKMCDENVKRILANIFSRYIFSALQRNCDKRSEMNYRDRKNWLDGLYEDVLFKELVEYLTVSNGLQGVLNRLLKSKNKSLCLMCGRFIFVVKEKLPVLFAKVKKR